MKVYHILNSCQVKVFLFFIFYMVREQAGRKLPIQNVSYQQPRGCKNCKSGFLCLTQPAFTRRPWRGNASPVLPCTCAAVYLLQFQQPLSSFVQTHWMGMVAFAQITISADGSLYTSRGCFSFSNAFSLYFKIISLNRSKDFSASGILFTPVFISISA